MTKIVKALILVLMLTVMLPISPAEACACGPNWSTMSSEQVASFINAIEDGQRNRDAEQGLLPPPPPGYSYTKDHKLVPS
jgi:hypothetical protein